MKEDEKRKPKLDRNTRFFMVRKEEKVKEKRGM